MKMKSGLSALLLASLLCCSAAEPVAHRFLKSGCGSGSVAIVGANGKVEWEYPIADETSDSWLLPDGNIIFAFKHGVREVDAAKKIVWEYLAPKDAEVHACQPLGEGWFLLGESRKGGSKVMEMNREQKVRLEFTIADATGTAHNQFRQIRKTPQGTYLVTQQRGGGKAREFDATGKLVRAFTAGRFVAIRLPNGNTLLGCGDEHRLIEVDPQDKIVWQVTEKELPGNQLGCVAGLHRLANGNTVICNWSGHAGAKQGQPQLVEITPEKKVVWEIHNPALKMISSINILDSGDPLADKSWR
jgi:hypothetical protein